jgi:signal transduction histidine kinase
LRWRWLIAGLSLGLGLLVEIGEHTLLIHIDEAELIMYAVVLPPAIWLLLTLLARMMAKRTISEVRLDRHQQLVHQLEKYHDHHELTHFIARFPATLLPVEHAALYVYDHKAAQHRLAAYWSAVNAGPWPITPLSTACQSCVLSQLPHYRHGPAQEYCQPLAYDNLLIGSLRIFFRSGAAIDRDQLDFLNNVSSKIALALALSIAEPLQMEQARAVAQQDERRRIAYELHDSLAQQIGFLHLNLDRLANDSALLPDAFRLELREMRDVANDAYRRIRDHLAILRSGGYGDLARTLRNYTRTIGERYGLEIEVASHGAPAALSPILQQEAFGLIQEGLNNVIKHAEARQATITLQWSPELLGMELSDDGVGFDPTDLGALDHYGLTMMRERVEAMQGQMTIDSMPGRGARLTFYLPLASCEISPSHEHAPMSIRERVN